MRKIIFPLLLGITGVAVLVYLGVWQLQRLAWKEGILANIDARIAAAPVSLPNAVSVAQNNYDPVIVSGTPSGEELHVLVSGTAAGTGYRVISGFRTVDGRNILVDQGLLALEDKALPPQQKTTQIVGNLIWPDDWNSSTPDPDLAKNIWFARDVIEMAAALNTQPLMIVARTATQPDPRVTPLPVNTANIKNDHREYAITWFLLAAVWAVMTGFLIQRTLRNKDA